MMNLKKISGVILIIIAVVMLYFGIDKGMLPPALTGVGFIFIGLVFLTEKGN